MNKILVSGSIAYDHIMHYNGYFHEAILKDNIENLNVSFLIDSKEIHFGGSGGNIAYNLKLLGEDPILIGSAGKDFGEYKKWIEQKNISLEHIHISDKTYTASGLVTTDKKGNQVWNFYPGAMNEDFPIDLTKIKNELSYAIISPDNMERMRNIIHECKRLKIPYIFDPGQSIINFSPKQLMECVEGSLALIVNEYEYSIFKEKTKWGKTILINKTTLLITTLGEKGSIIETKDTQERIGIVKANTIADPTGCGDAYRAGILQGLKKKYSHKKMGQLGALLATYNIENMGSQNHKFTQKEFEKRYKNNFCESL